MEPGREDAIGATALAGGSEEGSLTIQDWLSDVLAATMPLDWERYRVTMEAATWKALWADVEATHGYEDGVEATLRLLEATQVHRAQLGAKAAEARAILLYRTLLTMLDKADRWETYLAVWETLGAHPHPCVPMKADRVADGGARFTPFVQRADGGFGAGPRPCGIPPPPVVAVHFLHTHARRKAMIERKLRQARTDPSATARPVGLHALSTEAIQRRLAQVQEGDASQ
jgi:hypothetical protein